MCPEMEVYQERGVNPPSMEGLKLPTPEKKQGINSVVRNFPWMLCSPEEIIDQVEKRNEGISSGRLSTIKVIVGKKKENSVPSPCYIAPVGGNINPGEDYVKAGFRELGEETTLQPPVINPNIGITIFRTGGYRYKILPYCERQFENKTPTREAMFLSFPVFRTRRIDNPHPEKDKLEAVIQVSIEELKQLINGQGDLFLESCQLGGPKGVIEIDKENIQKKDQAILGLVNYLEIVDQESYEIIKNKLRKVAERSEVDFTNCSSENLEGMISYLKDIKGKDWLLRQLGQVMTVVEANYCLAPFGQKRDERKTDREESIFGRADEVFRQLNNDQLGIGLFHLLPKAVMIDPNLLIDDFPQLANFISLWDDLVEFYKQRQFPELGENEISFIDEGKMIDDFSEELYTMFNIITGRSVEFLKKSLRGVDSFINYMEEVAKDLIEKKGSMIMHQPYGVLPEIHGESLGKLVLLASGRMIFQEVDSSVANKVRYEALRHLLLWMKKISIDPIYKNKLLFNPKLVNSALLKFLGNQRTIDDEKGYEENGAHKHIEIRYPYELKNWLRKQHKKDNFEELIGKLMLIEIDGEKLFDRNYSSIEECLLKFLNLLNANGIFFVVDKREVKSSESFMRKSFHEDPESIKDVYATAVAPVYKFDTSMQDKAFNNRVLPLLFLSWFSDELASSKGVYEIKTGKLRIDGLKNFELLCNNNGEVELPEAGIRPGSKSSLIPRVKFILKLSGPSSEVIELSFYLADSLEKVMGWFQKIADGVNRYDLERNLLPLNQYMPEIVGLSSLFELIFPPEIYPGQTKKVRLARQS